MFQEITTARCRLRLLQERDLAAFVRYRTDPDVARYQSWDTDYTLADAQALCAAMHAGPFGQTGEWYQIAIVDQATDALLGDLALHFIDAAQVEIGFTLAAEQQGQGYAREALSALLGYVFTTLGRHRASAVIDVRNTAAARLLERVGMRREAHFRQNIFFKGAWGDEYVYAMLAAEWRERQQ